MPNPWEQAVPTASTPDWTNEGTKTTATRPAAAVSSSRINFSMEHASTEQLQQQQQQQQHDGPYQQEEWASMLVRYLVVTWHAGDGFLGLVMALYGLFLTWSRAPTASEDTPLSSSPAKVWILYVCAIWFLLRSTVGLYSLYKDVLGRIGLLVSAYMSIVWSLLLFVLSMICVGVRHAIGPYLQQHASQWHLSASVLAFFQHNEHFCWIVLLVGCTVELLRYFSLSNYREYLLEEDELALQLVVVHDARASSRRKKPWWWNTGNNHVRHADANDNTSLGDPLLGPSWTTTHNRSYLMEEGLEHSNNNTSFWNTWFGKRNNATENARDIDSVGFASVQDEWASRSEEDPLWWTREEAGAGGGAK